MKWSSTGLVAIVTLTLMGSAQASWLSFKGSCKSGHCGECSTGCEPIVIRPTCRKVFNYQRQCSLQSCGECCDRTCAAPGGCGPCSSCADAACCAPIGSEPACQAPCGTTPAEGTCCAPPSCSVDGCSSGCATGCTCGEGCHDAEACRVIAELIHQSRTGCYATIRRRAIHRLGDHFDACCHPEIMSAFVYALNDSDERVRAKAADEIGDQVRRNRCICGPSVIAALQCALADCDRIVRREAEQSLRACGYEVVDNACGTSCGTYCPASSGYSGSYTMPSAPSDATPAAPAPAPAPEPAPAPVNDAPPEVSDVGLKLKSVSWRNTASVMTDDQVPLIPAPQDEPVNSLKPADSVWSEAVPPPAPATEPEDVPVDGSDAQPLPTAPPARVIQTSALQPVETPVGVR
ncbi:MAG: HEAT repeat domain-containing protein [Planctomycetaceae bacterium]|nr:HEAT repeat domain-containing protein [Planctomycetaceae bacterium]